METHLFCLHAIQLCSRSSAQTGPTLKLNISRCVVCNHNLYQSDLRNIEIKTINFIYHSTHILILKIH